MFFLAEYVNMVTVSAVATSLYLGGWLGPLLPSWLGWMWFLLKVFLLLFFYVWIQMAVRVIKCLIACSLSRISAARYAGFWLSGSLEQYVVHMPGSARGNLPRASPPETFRRRTHRDLLPPRA